MTRPALALAVSLLFSISAEAALVTYSFTSQTANATGPFSPENVASGVNASTLVGTNMGSTSTANSGGVVTAFGNATDGSTPAYTFDGFGYEVGAATMTNDSTGAIDLTPLSTFVFSITPTGSPIQYTSLTLDFGWDLTTTPAGTQVSYDLYYTIGSGTQTRVGTTSSYTTAQNHAVVNDLAKDLFSQPAFTNPVSETVTFELRFADSNSGLNTKRLFIDDINVVGTVVPEPSTAMLVAGAIAVTGFIRRRRLS
ncbi:MAG TPA: PEP-CTERM sorting domain-containing protein [Luteolibacter sp.]|nr:PEP-CTERM sorting domain-containing protein [Luteolibacter sp.]